MFRWFALAALLGCLGISTYYRHRARREGGTIPRAREQPLLASGRAAVGLPLVGAMLTYVAHPPWMAWASAPLPEWTRWIGVGLGLLAVPAAYWVFTSLGSNVSETVLTKERHELVTRGPYRWIRHPLYATGIALIVAVGLMGANWFILLMAAIAVTAIRLVVVPMEERALVATFGEEYRRYMARTGGLVPRVLDGRSRSGR